jgi:hypothetical protein
LRRMVSYLLLKYRRQWFLGSACGLASKLLQRVAQRRTGYLY